jgi:hypothetical protein
MGHVEYRQIIAALRRFTPLERDMREGRREGQPEQQGRDHQSFAFAVFHSVTFPFLADSVFIWPA